MTYEEVIESIQGKEKFGSLSGALITKLLLEKLCHPEGGIPYVHVAGTNGKGSVSAFLCSIFQEAGLKAGMFTSPHLVDFRERIQINGELISKEDMARIGERLLNMELEIRPTMYDYCLALALLYFKEQKCDVMILETGLGGKLDSTNGVGTPEVAVITKIGFDHMAILGDTLPKIAEEKAGIIKTGSKIICESQTAEVEQVFLDKAKEAGASSIHIIQEADIKIERSENGACFSAYGYEEMKLQMLGVHQYENAAAALLAAEAFLAPRIDVAKRREAIKAGLYKTRWQGRMELLSEEPFLMVDGAHNPQGVSALCESLRRMYPYEKFHFWMGVMADKDYEDMIEEIGELAIDFTTVTVGGERSLSARNLAECISKKGIPAYSKDSLEEVLKELPKERREKTVAFGSLYFIGEIKERFQIK